MKIQFKRLDRIQKTLVLVGMLLFLLALWMLFFRIETVAVAPGRVIPSTMVKIIQNFEGGILKGIHIKTGERVKKDDLLFTFDTVTFKNEYEATEKQIEFLALRLQRLDSEIDGRELKFNPELSKRYPEQVVSELREYEARRLRLMEFQSMVSLAQEELGITSRLAAKGLESKAELLRMQKQDSERRQMLSAWREEAMTQATQLRADIQVKLNSLSVLEDKLSRSEVRSPQDGIVGSVAVTTVGGTVKPGEPLAQLVPDGDEMIIEARLPVEDIGFVTQGSRARVSFTAYDPSVFGALEAEVLTISPDATVTEQGAAFYVVRLRSLGALQTREGKKLGITPGMVADVRIITGHRTFFEYLFKPIQRATNNAFRES